MQALAVIDMQRWMFRYPERAAQLGRLVPVINALAANFAAAGLPEFDVRVVHKEHLDDHLPSTRWRARGDQGRPR